MAATNKAVVRQIIDTVTVECSLGHKHTYIVYAEKILSRTDEVREKEGPYGYSDSERSNPIYIDAQGRLYDSYTSVDYYANTRYVRRDDKSHWLTSKVQDGVRFDKVGELR